MIPEKRMPSVMSGSGHFSAVPDVQKDRSVFNRSHGYKTTFDAGLLIPVFVDYAMPGDTYDVRMTALARLNTPLKPFMDNMFLESFFFAVPFRLIWANAVKFFGEQTNPGDSIAFTVPIYNGMPAAGFALHTVWDYFALPTVGTPAVTASINVSALPMRALALVYNQWFRDENLINSVTVPVTDGPDTTATYAAALAPFKRGKRFDYFTSCLPSPQKGSAAKITPSGSVPVVMAGITGESAAVVNAAGTQRNLATAAGTNPVDVVMKSTGGGITMTVDLSGLTINDLRLSIATQQFLETDARGGTRYPELIYRHFGVVSSDARLQRAEYLGGGSSRIVVAPVAQTNQVAVPTNKDGLGNLGAVAAGLVSGHGFSKSFEEHCVVIGLVNVRADLTYSQGIERFWNYSTRYDFPWPVFANIGEQAVLNREIYATGAAADANVFGYQERHGERRYKPSKITGLFRPSAAANLSVFHLSELFGALPTLGQTFIEDQTTSVLATRIAVPAEPDFSIDAWFDFKMASVLPVYGMPGLRRL